MRIYLDHNATTPLRPEARAAMLPVLDENFGNPSSTHWGGAEARDINGVKFLAQSLTGVSGKDLPALIDQFTKPHYRGFDGWAMG